MGELMVNPGAIKKNTQDIGNLSSLVTTEKGSLVGAINEIGKATQRDVPFTIAVADWSAVTGGFSATYSSAYVTTTCKYEILFSPSLTNAQAHIKWNKASGGGGIVFTTATKPTDAVMGIIRIVDADDGVVPVIIEDTVVGLANGGTGQSSLAGAQQVLGITALNTNTAKKPVRISDTGRITSSTTLTYTGKHVTIPAGSYYCVRGFGIYTGSSCTGLVIGSDNDPTHTYNYYAAYLSNTQSISCCGYAVNALTLYLHAQYASAAQNDVGLDGFYIPAS